MHKLRIGDRVLHRRREQYGTYDGPTADPEVVWVKFDDSNEPERVTRASLSKIF